MKNQTPDKTLVEGLLAQDSLLITELYERLRPSAKRLIEQYGGQDSDVDDMLQESIIALYVNLKKNQYQKHAEVKLSSYVLQILKYQWLNNRSKAYRKKELRLMDNYEKAASVDIQKDLEHLEFNQTIRKVIEQLPKRCQTIFELFYWKKESMKNIAIQLGLTTDSTKNAKYRCVQKAKLLLEGSNIKIDS